MEKEIEKALSEPLDPKAISQHPTKKYLSSIKAIYVTERFNQVFGTGKWTIKVEHIDTQPKALNSKVGDMVVIKTTFEVPEEKIYYECYGGNDNADLGDAYKGATTDAITKIGSYLGVGINVFKGIESTEAPKVSKTDKQKIEIGKLLEVHNPLMETPEEYRETCEKITGFELIEANFAEILNHLKKK